MTALAGAVLGFLTGCGWCCLLAMHWRRVSVRALEEAAAAKQHLAQERAMLGDLLSAAAGFGAVHVAEAAPSASECRRLYDLPAPKESR